MSRIAVGRAPSRKLRWLSGAAALLLSVLPLSLRAEAPAAADVLRELGFPASAEQSVLGGEFVKVDVKSTNDRELAVGLAFLVKVPPQKFMEELQAGLLLETDPNAIAHGPITGSLADFQKLTLTPDGKSQVELYRDVEPGEDMNLSAEEIAAFNALKGKPAAQVEDQVRKALLARYQAYRASGLAGIAPYARGRGKQTFAGKDLESASKASAYMKKELPAFYQVLLGYPQADAPGLTEQFSWVTYRAHGTPVRLLVHGFALTDGDAIAVCQRQFYVSGSYNAEQAVAGFLPVKEGTVVVYVNRTSTDQVTGFGGSAKRSIGSGLLASQLEDLFADLQKAATKK